MTYDCWKSVSLQYNLGAKGQAEKMPGFKTPNLREGLTYNLHMFTIKQLMENPPPVKTYASFSGMIIKKSDMEMVGSDQQFEKIM